MDKIQIELRVLKITDGIQSLPRPSRRDSQANVVRLQTCLLQCGICSHEVDSWGQYIQSTGKQYSQDTKVAIQYQIQK